MVRKAAPTTRSLQLEGDLDLFAIHAQWEQVLPLLAGEGGTVELDLAGIGDLDLAGIQLLSALDRDLRARRGSLVLSGTKDEWAPRFETIGLAGVFEEKEP